MEAKLGVAAAVDVPRLFSLLSLFVGFGLGFGFSFNWLVGVVGCG